jgi:hypothetical protein
VETRAAPQTRTHLGDERARRVGVLFVHGIGEQQQSESIRWFGGALVRWLGSWHAARAGSIETVAAHLSYGGGLEGPARFEVRIPAHQAGSRTWPEHHWVIAEGWWAARISPPSFREMISWGLRSGGRALQRLFVQAADKLKVIAGRLGAERPDRPVGKSDPGLVGALIEFVSTLLLAALYLAALPLLYVLLLVLFAISLIPIEQWRTFALTRLIEPFLVEGLGDFKTYMQDDVQALHIRTRIDEDVRFLVEEEHCEDLIVVAHSHGAVVAFDALASHRLPYLDRIRKFITVGAALNNAWALHPECARLRAPLPAHIYWVDFWSYYDPVPGGQLTRTLLGAAPVVDPGPGLQAEMRWYEEYVHPGTVQDRSHTAPTGPLPRQVTNGMNVLNDHDGYFRNAEQFLSRVAAEIDLPHGYYERSRFHPRDLWQRTKRRRLRVTTLVGWRLGAMALFVLALGTRIAGHGWLQLTIDGRGVGGWIERIPGATALAAPGEVVNALRLLLSGAAASMQSLPLLSATLASGADLLAAPQWSDLRDGVIALLFFAATFTVLYLVLVRLLFRPWDEREARESVLDELPPHHPGVGRRSLIVALVLAALAVVVAGP